MNEPSLKELTEWWINSNRLPNGSEILLKRLRDELAVADGTITTFQGRIKLLESQLAAVTKERDKLVRLLSVGHNPDCICIYCEELKSLKSK